MGLIAKQIEATLKNIFLKKNLDDNVKTKYELETKIYDGEFEKGKLFRDERVSTEVVKKYVMNDMFYVKPVYNDNKIKGYILEGVLDGVVDKLTTLVVPYDCKILKIDDDALKKIDDDVKIVVPNDLKPKKDTPKKVSKDSEYHFKFDSNKINERSYETKETSNKHR